MINRFPLHRLFKTDNCYLLVYETTFGARCAAAAAASARGTAHAYAEAAATANWWAERLKCLVWYSEPGDVFLVLEENKKQNLLKVLHGNRVGWIFDCAWLGLEEVNCNA